MKICAEVSAVCQRRDGVRRALLDPWLEGEDHDGDGDQQYQARRGSETEPHASLSTANGKDTPVSRRGPALEATLELAAS